MSTALPRDYSPYDDDTYMSYDMLAYFKDKLLKWQEDIQRQVADLREELRKKEDSADILDVATSESSHSIDLRTQDRLLKLLKKIEEALLRIEEGSYGYCLKSGEPIGVGRLDARPVAEVTLPVQEAIEKMENTTPDSHWDTSPIY